MVDLKEETLSYKVVMLGESGVGKTCIVNKYINNSFTNTTPTIGSNYCSKVETVQPRGVPLPVKVRLQIWDTAGGEQFRSLSSIYYKGASAVCLIYDSTNLESFENLSYWVDELRVSASASIVIALVASKVDDSDN